MTITQLTSLKEKLDCRLVDLVHIKLKKAKYGVDLHQREIDETFDLQSYKYIIDKVLFYNLLKDDMDNITTEEIILTLVDSNGDDYPATQTITVEHLGNCILRTTTHTPSLDEDDEVIYTDTLTTEYCNCDDIITDIECFPSIISKLKSIL